MFNFNKREERKPREYKGTTLYVIKPNNIDIELYLDIIVKNIEGYVKQTGVMPQKLRLDYENYNRIIDYNKSLIYQEDGKYKTFGVEVEV